MTKRYSIYVTEYGSEKEVELCQVDCNPDSLVRALEEKTIKIYSGTSHYHQSSIRKYEKIRVVDNHAVR